MCAPVRINEIVNKSKTNLFVRCTRAQCEANKVKTLDPQLDSSQQNLFRLNVARTVIKQAKKDEKKEKEINGKDRKTGKAKDLKGSNAEAGSKDSKAAEKTKPSKNAGKKK